MPPGSVPPPARDACPGLLALHPGRDGHVARIRLPAGYVTGPRWLALADLARDLGDGHLDLTARGNVQLRGLRPEDAAELSGRAAEAGLLPSVAHDRARNIMASPLAGLDGRPPLRPLAEELDAALLADPAFSALPGRFLFSLDDGTGGAGLAGCDVGLRWDADGLDVVIAGRTTGVRAAPADAVAVAVAAARAAIAGGVGGSVTRIGDLADSGASVAAAIGGSLGPAAAGPDTRLPLGSAGGAGGRAQISSITMVVGAPLGRLADGQVRLIAGLLRPGEVIRLGIAGRIVIPLAVGPAGGSSSTRLAGPTESPVAESAGSTGLAGPTESPVAESAGSAGLVGPAEPAGPASAGSEPSGPAESAQVGDALARLASAGLLVADDDPLTGVTACSGAACHRSVADVRGAAGPLAGHPRTHWAGCARQCGLPPDAEPVIAVDADRYLIPSEVRPRLLVSLGVPATPDRPALASPGVPGPVGTLAGAS